jgi:YHS domain-containing protein
LPAADEVASAPPKPVETVDPAAETPRGLPVGAVKKASLDPVSRIMVDEESATAAGLKVEHKGKTYFFVSKESKDQFTRQPDLYVDEAEAVTLPPTPAPAAKGPVVAAAVKDPVCGKEVDVKAAVAARLQSDYKGTRYYFSSDDCKKKFDKEPGKYAVK